MKRNGLFVTGTDTDVGKTFVSAGISAVLKEKGLDIGVFKPIMSGVRREDSKSDAYLLKTFSQDTAPLEEINPFQFDEPLAPYVAALRQSSSVTMEEIMEKWKIIKNKRDFYLVEGAGGLAVPLGAHYLVADLAKAIGFPLLIVARPNLGTVNHTLLTISYARQKGLDVLGVVINGLDEERNGVAEQTNPGLIQEFTDVPVLGIIPKVKSFQRADVIQVFSERIDHVELVSRLVK